MRYRGRIYRPPSEADAYILQASFGCSWNHCTYCDMYSDQPFAPRPLEEVLEDLRVAAGQIGPRVRKLFVADGDALVLPVETWLSLLSAARRALPSLKRISCYATAINILEKSDDELRTLVQAGLTRLYIGPETGDDMTSRRIAKGSDFADHVEAARRAHEAGFELSVIALLGAGGVERSKEHAEATGHLLTAMDPAFFAALTLTPVPGTPIAKLAERGRFELPDRRDLLLELRTIIAVGEPSDALFRTNHASNYLPLAGRLPRDRDRIIALIDRALSGEIALRPEWSRGL